MLLCCVRSPSGLSVWPGPPAIGCSCVGLQTVAQDEAGSLPVFWAPGCLGPQSVFYDLVGPLAGSLLGQGHSLCSTIEQGHRLGSVPGWGCRLGGTVGWALRLPRVTVQAPWLCSRVGLLACFPSQAGL